jgi:hypothetical protein
MFEGFEGEGMKVKLHKLGKKNNLVNSEEGHYVFSCIQGWEGFLGIK